MDGHL